MDRTNLGAEAARLALPLLVERLGGTVEITEAEYDAFNVRHREEGLKPAVRVERISGGLRLTVVRASRPN